MEKQIKGICEKIKEVLLTKNKDYGDSFTKTLGKYGDVALMLRLEDKFNRLDSIFRKKEVLVEDEGFNDTVLDLAGYCLLYLATKEKQKRELGTLEKMEGELNEM